jgi:hypothetical protein
MLEPTIPVKETSQELYSVCVASHLPGDCPTLRGVVALTPSCSANGLPTTTLLLRVDDRSQLLSILTELHEANLAILSLNLVRGTELPW